VSIQNHYELTVDESELTILRLALRALSTLRLNPKLAYRQVDCPPEFEEYMNEMLNGFTGICCQMDSLIDEMPDSIKRIETQIDLLRGEDVFETFRLSLAQN